MPSRLTETDVEQAAIEWLEQQGYSYIHGSEIERPLKEVILTDRLLPFLEKQYPDLPETALKEVLSLITLNQGIDLDQRNHDFQYNKLIVGYLQSNWYPIAFSQSVIYRLCYHWVSAILIWFILYNYSKIQNY